MNNGEFERRVEKVRQTREFGRQISRFLGDLTLKLVALGRSKSVEQDVSKIGNEAFREKFGYDLLDEALPDVEKTGKSDE